MKNNKLTLLLFFLTGTIFAQKEITSNTLFEKIIIDGNLQEPIWKKHLKKVNFRQLSPNNGKPHFNVTRIAVANDNTFFYVAAELYSTSINKNLTYRDDTGTSDYFGIIIDLFGENREAWAFLVTPANVQTDIKLTANVNYGEWNAAWESAVKIYNNKWTIEFKIPFNSLRFPKDDLSNVSINFERFDAATNEDSFWNYVNADIDGFLNQSGKLKGLKNINPPINLSFSPFISVVNEKNPNIDSKTTFNGGLDLKYVHKNAYTFDISLIPDFSQTPSDNQIFNLSPFEIKYNENRQFFVEGTEIFDKGNYLYTRRIGGIPIDKNNISLQSDETISNNPISSNILNLIKATGKSKNGFSVGFLNGITAKSEAEIKNKTTDKIRKDITNPISNYNSVVIDKTLKNNSSITFINNSVIRNGSFYDANLTALLYRWYNKKRTYAMSFSKAISQKYFSEKENEFGHQYYAEFSKISGKIQGKFTANLLDDTFDNNDFGYLSRNNKLYFKSELSYTENAPKKIFSNYSFSANYTKRYYYSLFKKELSYYKLGTQATFKKNNHKIFFDLLYFEKGTSFYEARTKDQAFNLPQEMQVFLEYQTNRNKRLSFAGYVIYLDYLNTSIYSTSLYLGYEISARIGQHLYAHFSQSYQNTPNNLGYLTLHNDDIIFSNRSINELANSLKLNYAVNSTLNISTKIRHYWTQIDYSNQFTLLNNGEISENNLDINVSDFNKNYNHFTLDFLAKWQFAPASEMSLGYKLGAILDNNEVNSSYFKNLRTTLKENSNHTISLKMTYFIDYKTLRSKTLF